MSIKYRCCEWKCCQKALSTCRQIKCFKLWKAVFAELLGTLFFVLLACGSTVWTNVDQPGYVITVALSFGLTAGTVIWCIAEVSGGHINPAVTFGMLMTGKIHFVPAILYMTAQCIGAIIGAAYLESVTPAALAKTLGANIVHSDVVPSSAFGVETAVTYVLVLTVFASCDGTRNMYGSSPLSIGLAVAIGNIFAVSRYSRLRRRHGYKFRKKTPFRKNTLILILKLAMRFSLAVVGYATRCLISG